MKKNEIIELNGKEYTLELNRDSFIQIDKICNVSKSMEIIQQNLYDYIDDIDDDFNPETLLIDENEIDKKIEEKEKILRKIVERAFFIWLYPNHKLNITQVRELIEPYFEDEKKGDFIAEKLGQYLQECVKIRDEYNQERKNLKAQANKK